MHINVSFVFELTQKAVKIMPSGGRIINISSVLESEDCSRCKPLHYGKHALSGFTRGGVGSGGSEHHRKLRLPGLSTPIWAIPMRRALRRLKIRAPGRGCGGSRVLASPEASYVTGPA